MKRLCVLCIALCISTAALFAEGAAEEGGLGSFPEKDLTLIVPWSAGGGTDTIARALVQNAQEYIGVNVNVVNRTGGQGAVGMGAVMSARPDGYTAGVITFGLSTYDLMGLSDMTYRDFELIQLLNQSPAALSVRSDSPWESLEQVMQHARENPGSVSVGHTGAGVAWHLSAAALGTTYDIEFNFVPFDGAAPTRSALLGGHIDLAVTGIDEMKQQYEAGEVRLLAVNAPSRHTAFPDVPTIEEEGYGLDAVVLDWRGLALPLGVPEERVEFLREGFLAMFSDPGFQRFSQEVGLVLVYEDADGFETFLDGMEQILEPTLDAVGLLK